MILLYPTGYLHVGLSEIKFQSKHYCYFQGKSQCRESPFQFSNSREAAFTKGITFAAGTYLYFIHFSILPIKLLNEIWGCKKKGQKSQPPPFVIKIYWIQSIFGGNCFNK